MKEKKNNILRPDKPVTPDEWDLWERTREVSHCFGVDGKIGKEAHREILRRLREDFGATGAEPAQIERDIMSGMVGGMIKENLLLGRFRAGEELSEQEREFLESHSHFIK